MIVVPFGVTSAEAIADCAAPVAMIDLRHPLAVLSNGYWRARFASDPAIVGKQIVVNGRSLTIIGVSAEGFDGVEPGRAPQIRVPMTMKDELPHTANGRLNSKLHDSP